MKNILKTLMALFLLALSFACTDQIWEEHYSSAKSNAVLDKSLMDLMKEDSVNLSSFLKILRMTEYDSVLTQTQSFTVWAPDNKALEGQVDWTDLNSLKIIVRNHVSRYPYPSSTVSDTEVRMLNKKRHRFVRQGETLMFAGSPVSGQEKAARNGIFYKITAQVPFIPNIWEYINYTDGLDSIHAYMNMFELYEFDEANSQKLDNDSLGRSVYDSIFIYKNELFTELGSISTEDSTYTMLIPNNTAWNDIYEQISACYVYNEIPSDEELAAVGSNEAARAAYTQTKAEEARALRDQTTKHKIVENLIYRNDWSLEDIKARAWMKSTSGRIVDSDQLFANIVEDTVLSNGHAYVVDKLNYTSDMWCDSIIIEAENFSYHVSDTDEVKTRRAYQRSLYDSWLKDSLDYTIKSGDGYLDVSPRSIAIRPYINFYIPNTLSMSYNIYCVFLPQTAALDTTLIKYVNKDAFFPTKVRYTLSYTNTNGKTTSRTFTNKNFETDPNGITKMLVTSNAKGEATPVKFPYCGEGRNGNVTLRITSAVETKDMSDTIKPYTRSMFIDRIILEPVY